MNKNKRILFLMLAVMLVSACRPLTPAAQATSTPTLALAAPPEPTATITPTPEICGDSICTEAEATTCHADCGAEAASCPINSYACNGEEGPCCPSLGYIPVRVERFNNEDGEWYRVTVPTTIPISIEFTPFGGDPIPWESTMYGEGGHSTVFVYPFNEGVTQLYMVSDQAFFEELSPGTSVTHFVREDVVPLAYINASGYMDQTMWQTRSKIESNLRIFVNGVKLDPVGGEMRGEDEDLSFILDLETAEEVILVVTRNGHDYATQLSHPLPRMITDSEQRRAIHSRLVYTAEFLPEKLYGVINRDLPILRSGLPQIKN